MLVYRIDCRLSGIVATPDQRSATLAILVVQWTGTAQMNQESSGRERAKRPLRTAGKEIPVTKLLGISGSLRRGSFNSALLRAGQSVLDEGVELEIATLHGVPLYDGDVEAAEGVPEAVQRLKDRVTACDGLILATPEYNNGIPGVFKNAIDWMSRPAGAAANVFANRPLAIIGASPGGFGTILAQDHWLPTLRALGVRPWFRGRMLVSRANKLFDDSGQLTDEATREQLRRFLHGFAEFAAAPR
jgi:chromate reductase